MARRHCDESAPGRRDGLRRRLVPLELHAASARARWCRGHIRAHTLSSAFDKANVRGIGLQAGVIVMPNNYAMLCCPQVDGHCQTRQTFRKFVEKVPRAGGGEEFQAVYSVSRLWWVRTTTPPVWPEGGGVLRFSALTGLHGLHRRVAGDGKIPRSGSMDA